MTNNTTDSDTTNDDELGDFDDHGTVGVADTPDEDPRGRKATTKTTKEVAAEYFDVPVSRVDQLTDHDPLADDFQLGDVCIDLATGRAVQVIGLPSQTVAEWSGDNGYNLLENYANQRTRARPNDPVVECVYVSSVQSEPNGPRGSDSGGYTFPSSRLARVTVESVEGVRRPYDAIAVDVLRRLFAATDRTAVESEETLALLTHEAAIDEDVHKEARELADVEQRFGGDEDDGE